MGEKILLASRLYKTSLSSFQFIEDQNFKDPGKQLDFTPKCNSSPSGGKLVVHPVRGGAAQRALSRGAFLSIRLPFSPADPNGQG